MPDQRYNDISRKLRSLAKSLETQAQDHRKLADQLEHLIRTRPPAISKPQHLVALDAAAMQLIDLPAAEIRTQAAVVARAAGQQVLPVAIRAQQLRRERKARKRREDTIDLISRMADGMTLKDASASLGLSEATGRRLRDAWIHLDNGLGASKGVQ